LRGDRNRCAVSMRPASSVAGRRATSRAPRRRTITVSCWSTTRSRMLARFTRRLVYVVSLGMSHPIRIVQHSCTDTEITSSMAETSSFTRGARICHPKPTCRDQSGLRVRSRLAGVISVARGAFRVPGFPPPRPPEKLPPVRLLYGAMRPASRVGKPCSPAPVLRSIRGVGAAL